MSTGIGKHKYSSNNNDVYSPDTAFCPYCNNPDCFADFCDVGIGMVQCGPYYCQACEASEISSLDTRKLTEKEKETGWYEPHTPVSETANTANGKLVDINIAKILNQVGLLDKK